MFAPLSLSRVKQTVRRFLDPLLSRVRLLSIFNSSREKESAEWDSKLRAATPVFVYQMGKVASTAIYQALTDSDYPGAIIHGHTYGEFNSDPGIRALYRYRKSSSPAIKIISLVREPVSRNVSAFFQNIRRDAGRRSTDSDVQLRRLKNKFLNNYPHEIPLIWFDNNIKKNFGIDVYETDFPSSGYIRVNRQNVELLLMRHDLPNQLKTELIAEFTATPDLVLANNNVGADKDYSELYAQFKNVKLPLRYLHYLAASKYMKHFFKPQMRQIIEKWSEEPLPGRKSA